MRLLSSVLSLLFAAVASATSTSGDRLLILLDDVADKSAYSQFLGDLYGNHDVTLCIDEVEKDIGS